MYNEDAGETLTFQVFSVEGEFIWWSFVNLRISFFNVCHLDRNAFVRITKN